MKSQIQALIALSLLVLGACTTGKNALINQVDDDVYWNKKDRNSGGVHINDVEPWNKNKKGPNESLNYQQPGSYAPAAPAPSGSAYDAGSSNSSYDRQRAEEAYRSWNAQRYNNTSAAYTNDTPVVDPTLQYRANEREERRLGSQRSYYYNDPYYNALSPSWGWTSFYQPIYRPGFYNWAPGWNVGLGWSRRTGWNVGVGYNMGWGGFYSGYSPWAYDPWYCDPFYRPYGYGWGYGYGFYNPWNYYGFYNPWYSRWGYGGYYPYGYMGFHRYPYFGGSNDVVTNRPMFRPRTSLSSSVPATGSRPGGTSEDGQLMNRGVRPGDVAVPANRNNPDQQQVITRPSAPSRPGSEVYQPTRPDVANPSMYNTNRPGGELINDGNGRPVYVNPERNTRPVSGYSGQQVYSDRPGGDLMRGNDGRTIYVPSRPSNPSLRPEAGYGNERMQPSSGSSDRYDGGSRPSIFGGGSRPGNEGRNYSNQTVEPGSSRPSYSSPRMAPSGGGGGGGGSFGGGSSGGGGGRSRPR